MGDIQREKEESQPLSRFCLPSSNQQTISFHAATFHVHSVHIPKAYSATGDSTLLRYTAHRGVGEDA
jgi:hypothetical protein